MRLLSADGAFVDLRPVAYEFPSRSADGPGDWDANWLVVAGEILLRDGRRWSFSDPSLTTWEALSLGDWLRGVARGEVEPTVLDSTGQDDDADPPPGVLAFLEPNLRVSLAERSDETAVVRVHVAAEAAPPWVRRGWDTPEYVVLLHVPLLLLFAAVDDWHREVSSFPVR